MDKIVQFNILGRVTTSWTYSIMLLGWDIKSKATYTVCPRRLVLLHKVARYIIATNIDSIHLHHPVGIMLLGLDIKSKATYTVCPRSLALLHKVARYLIMVKT